MTASRGRGQLGQSGGSAGERDCKTPDASLCELVLWEQLQIVLCKRMFDSRLSAKTFPTWLRSWLFIVGAMVEFKAMMEAITKLTEVVTGMQQREMTNMKHPGLARVLTDNVSAVGSSDIVWLSAQRRTLR